MPSPYVVPVEIGFKHCDPAGIVFYPRYVEIINDTVEHWFKHGLAASFAHMHGERRIVMPVASLQCEFKAPSRLGEQIDASLSVEKIGRSSLTLNVALLGPSATLRLAARLVVVFADMDSIKPVAIPPDVRTAIERYLA